jgi:hypothetical protein
MAVSLTEQQVRDRTKTVTRRTGWRMLRVGDQLTLCKKVMGRRCGEPLDRITDVEVTGIRRERLDAITPDDVTAEGSPAGPSTSSSRSSAAATVAAPRKPRSPASNGATPENPNA